MFSISHGPDGSFRLDIHGSPADLEATDARRLHAVLTGLARELRAERRADVGGPAAQDTSETRPGNSRSDGKTSGPRD